MEKAASLSLSLLLLLCHSPSSSSLSPPSLFPLLLSSFGREGGGLVAAFPKPPPTPLSLSLRATAEAAAAVFSPPSIYHEKLLKLQL